MSRRLRFGRRLSDALADRRGPGLAVVLGAVLVVIVFGVVLRHLWYPRHAVTDLTVFYLLARRIASGDVPYRDFPFEYPPLTLPFYLAPDHLHGDLKSGYLGYRRWFTAEMLLFAIATCTVVVVTSWRLWRSRLVSVAAAVFFAVSLAALGTIVQDRLDMAAALTIAVATLLLVSERLTATAAVIGLGIALKYVPGLLLGLVLPLAGQIRRALSLGLVCLAVALAPFLPFLVLAPQGIGWSLWRHTRRPIEIESLPATVILLRHVLGGTPAHVRWSYGSFAVTSSWAGVLSFLSSALTIGAIAGVWVLIVLARPALSDTPTKLPLAALTILLAAVAPGKVLSPQYLIWLLPLVVLVALDDLALGSVAFGAFVMTGIGFPSLFLQLLQLRSGAIAVVAVRNILLLVALALGVWRLWGLRRRPLAEGWSLARRMILLDGKPVKHCVPEGDCCEVIALPGEPHTLKAEGGHRA